MNASEIQQIDVFSDVSGADLETLAAAAKERSFPEGREIFRLGEVTDGFFVILEGTVRVARGDEVVNVLGSGAFFGESASLVAGPGYAMSRNASISADTDVKLVVIPTDEFQRLYSSDAGFRSKVDAAMSQREA